jgi:hypothetical protein
METEESFIFGEVITQPLLKWKSPQKDGGLQTGWECEIHTNSTLNGDVVVIPVQVCYDLVKWEPIRIGDMVKLSVQREQMSKTSKTGKVYQCNVVKRR